MASSSLVGQLVFPSENGHQVWEDQSIIKWRKRDAHVTLRCHESIEGSLKYWYERNKVSFVVSNSAPWNDDAVTGALDSAARLIKGLPFVESLSGHWKFFLASNPGNVPLNFYHTEFQDFEWETLPDKSPGPDGFSLAVFQNFWEEVKGDVMKVMEEFFQNGIINAVTNETYICLIPKKSESSKVGDFRPISLVTSLYKIVAKVLASRIKEVLEVTISSAQGAFVKGRQILDAVLIANEVVEEVRKKKVEGLVFKIDFEKAYDHVEWAFLDDILAKKGFGMRWRRWIMGCLSSANFSILINGRPRGKFKASRGLRQGDPLSPFLFTIVVDVLSRLMEKAQEIQLIKGLVVGEEAVEISHLQFADDTIFFLDGAEGSWSHLLELLSFFSTISGLKINKTKCSLVGINSDERKIERLAQSWGCEVGSWPLKYLGLPLGGNPRVLNFWNPVIEKVEKRLQSWKKAYLSRGGRLTLIRAVLGSIPIYYLSLFKLPIGVARNLEQCMRNFLWEGSEEGRKDHLIRWELVARSKEKGGLGVGNLIERNKSLLGKWLWRFPLEPQALWHRVLRSIYGINMNGWDVQPLLRGSSRSPWKEISKGFSSFLECCSFVVGNGEKVRFWEDKWLEDEPLKLLFPRLFRLSYKHNGKIAGFVDTSEFPYNWNLGFRRNLNDLETMEFVSLSVKLDSARFFHTREDVRHWSLESSGSFSCKSFRSFYGNNPDFSDFDPVDQIWKSKVPSKVHILAWLVAHGKVNTSNIIQKRRPFHCLNPQWCILCKAAEESVDHVFLHCPVSVQIWWRLFKEFGVSWVIPKSCYDLLSIRFSCGGSGKKAKILWSCRMLAVFWVIWSERNKRIFDDFPGLCVEGLWDRVNFWSALWTSVTPLFRNYSLSVLLIDWKSVVSY